MTKVETQIAWALGRPLWLLVSGLASGLACALVSGAMLGCGVSPAYAADPKTPESWPNSTSDAYANVSPNVGEYEGTNVGTSDPAADAYPGVRESAPMRPGQAIDVGAPQPGDIAIGASDDEYADTDPSALTEWKPALEGHGAWVDDATYGTVWVPTDREVGEHFEPYVSAGHWTYADDTSWVWVSDYSWGWVPFHYGRWVTLPGYGWSWIPGRRYAGAWVTWRTGGFGYDYVGWSAAPPGWYWRGGVALGWNFGWYHPAWSYCNRGYLYHPGVSAYVVRGGTPRAAAFEAHTRVYQTASPGVGGVQHFAASPRVGGSGVGVPNVGAAARVSAQPGLSGPRPSDLGISPSSVRAPPNANPGLARAQAFAAPRTAVPLGASSPVAARPFVSRGPGGPQSGSSWGHMPGGARPYPGNMAARPPVPMQRSMPSFSAQRPGFGQRPNSPSFPSRGSAGAWGGFRGGSPPAAIHGPSHGGPSHGGWPSGGRPAVGGRSGGRGRR